ncbi:MAG: chemotaxis protein CheD [Spirochaetales bacterium]|nr:chemotaxis protein CheD [Spirochaetales bacterium]
MHKSYDHRFKSEVITIYPGEYYISSSKEIITTILGSCVAVCLYDLENNIAGMNHFMLPEGSLNINELITKDLHLNISHISDKAMMYGIESMDVLIYMMQKKGAERRNLRAKIFGGGQILSNMTKKPSIGEQNIKFAKSYLNTEQITIENESVSDTYGRRIYFLTGTSSVFVKKIITDRVIKEELKYKEKLKELKFKPDITLY